MEGLEVVCSREKWESRNLFHVIWQVLHHIECLLFPEDEPPAPDDGLEPALGEALLGVSVVAADPLVDLGVLLLPRVRRRQDEQPAALDKVAGLK